jgi:hypothetical protein
MDLFNTAPTTQAGILAALRYMQIQHGDDGEAHDPGWLEDEEGGTLHRLARPWLDTLIESVDALGKAVA